MFQSNRWLLIGFLWPIFPIHPRPGRVLFCVSYGMPVWGIAIGSRQDTGFGHNWSAVSGWHVSADLWETLRTQHGQGQQRRRSQNTRTPHVIFRHYCMNLVSLTHSYTHTHNHDTHVHSLSHTHTMAVKNIGFQLVSIGWVLITLHTWVHSVLLASTHL